MGALLRLLRHRRRPLSEVAASDPNHLITTHFLPLDTMQRGASRASRDGKRKYGSDAAMQRWRRRSQLQVAGGAHGR
jgi:hypothetical protein